MIIIVPKNSLNTLFLKKSKIKEIKNLTWFSDTSSIIVNFCTIITLTYRIAGNFRRVQNFV